MFLRIYNVIFIDTPICNLVGPNTIIMIESESCKIFALQQQDFKAP